MRVLFSTYYKTDPAQDKMAAIYDVLRQDTTSRLNMGGWTIPEITSFIQIALCKPHLDAVEWLLTAPRTRIAELITDIRRCVLKPYLWISNELCGVQHSGGYRYGVRHTPDAPYAPTENVGVYYNMGLNHRVGAPAMFREDICIYRQRGREFRESGPVYVSPTCCTYINNSISHINCTNRRLIRFNRFNRHYFDITHRGGAFVILYNYDIGAYPYRLKISSGIMTLETMLRSETIAHPAFSMLCEVLEQYLTTYPIEAECEREWRRSQAELAGQ